MIEESQKKLTEKGQRTLKLARIIQFALLITVLIYGIVAQLNSPEEQAETMKDQETIHIIFSILGVGSCFFAAFLNRFFMRPRHFKDVQSADQMIGKMLVPFVLTWAIAESCAVFGLVLSIMLQDPSTYLAFGILSGLTIVAHPLTERRLDTQIKLLLS